MSGHRRTSEPVIQAPERRSGAELRAIRALAPYMWPKGQLEMRVRVTIAMVLLVAAKVATVAVPAVFGKAVDALEADATGAAIAVPISLLIGYGLLRVGQQAFAELRDFVFAKVGQRAIRSIALRIFKHLHALALRFHMDRQTGGLSRAIERGIKGIDFLLRFMLFNILPTMVEIGLVCGILWSLFGFIFSAITFVTVVIYIIFTLSFTEWRLKYRRAMNDSDSEANTKAIDSLLNFETVKYFGNEEHEASRYDSSMQRYEAAAVKSLTTLSLLNVGQGLIMALGMTILLVLSGFRVADGAMTIGAFTAVNLYMMQLFQPLNFLGFVYREIKQSLVDMEQMFGLLEENREIEDAPDARPLVVDDGVVRFEHVSFRYDPRRSVLKDVSFEVPAGSTVAIVGASGAGKSTISRLLFRFYDVDDGAISIDGQDIRAVTQQSLRAAIGIVPQDTVLFNDSVFYNIQYGRPSASPAEVEDAARLAQVHDFVMSLPDGYNTRVGERGLKLSGGEKQRVAIARTILKSPKILLFDEATSALDTHTEREIQAALEQVSADRTALVIAHRLSTVVNADEIIVLDDGIIIERGRHDDLLAQDGAYAELWRRQQAAALREEETASDMADGVFIPAPAK
ncbi:MAG: ABC transporter ATP-binding protein/permease [Rhodospirillaceae bacterium]|nr:ABC transporter ATP-binding protein/permease [Rhodospirillaceae bacterium]MBT5456632.1 ABC transporter ATP-binding protein/permease [Rhodospirillaceae bacterium]MBT5945134.1 ABC transporter ATP-binding protein/permease [Rhodospirillaceae bacterium]MBT6536107.1 ABC transporter ATP-binding protein/permease [Rhodospirillaceae bacterium]MBT7362658.1 ABC transporter ATP-binding protein/permease [Rhodospirillaceae bacterium]